jgi:hypothetical protein
MQSNFDSQVNVPVGIRFVILINKILAASTLLFFFLPRYAWWLVAFFGMPFSIAFAAVAFDVRKLKNSARIGAWFFAWLYLPFVFVAALAAYDELAKDGGLLFAFFLAQTGLIFLYAVWVSFYLSRKKVKEFFTANKR